MYSTYLDLPDLPPLEMRDSLLQDCMSPDFFQGESVPSHCQFNFQYDGGAGEMFVRTSALLVGSIRPWTHEHYLGWVCWLQIGVLFQCLGTLGQKSWKQPFWTLIQMFHLFPSKMTFNHSMAKGHCCWKIILNVLHISWEIHVWY